MKRIRYQDGSLRLYERAPGDRVWEYRWYETQPDGTRRRRGCLALQFLCSTIVNGN